MSSRFQLACAFALLAANALGMVHAQAPAARSAPATKAQQVFDQAAKEGKYTFILFYRADDAATRAMQQALKEALADEGERASVAYVQITNPAERPLVDKFDVARAPMPLTMAIAPNRAMTALYPQKLTAKNVADAFVTPGMTRCMKALQEGKVVLVCVQGTAKAVAPTAIKEFQADPHFKDRFATVSVKADDPDESRFMEQMEIDSTKVTGTVLAMLAPPGMLIGKFDSRTPKDEMAAALAKAGKCCDDPNCKHHQQTPATSAAPRSASRPAPSLARN